jgi:tRNA(Ile)-lysidine synthase
LRQVCRPLCRGGGDVAGFARENGVGLEEAARILRYAFLERAAEARGAVRIATAHTADDNAETLLLNLIRGTGLRGLGGIPPVRGRIVRPLLAVTRREVEEYLGENGLPHVEDSSNAGDGAARKPASPQRYAGSEGTQRRVPAERGAHRVPPAGG